MLPLLLGALVFSQLLTFDEAIARASLGPGVQGAIRAAEERRSEASGLGSITENPLIQVQPGVRDMRVGGSGAEVYVTLDQRIKLTGYGTKRKAAVQREVSEDAASAQVALRSARLANARAWLSAWSAVRVQESAAAEVALAAELEQRVQAAFVAGEITKVDVALIHAWQAEARLLAISAEGECFDRGLELAQASGLLVPGPVGAVRELPEIDVPEALAVTARLPASSQHPRALEARARREAESARLAELRAAKGTEIGFGAMAWREGGGDVAAVGTLDLVLPVFEHGRRESSVAAANVARAEQAERLAELDVHKEQLQVVHELEHSAEVLHATEDALLKAAEELADAQQKRLEAHEGTTQEWVLARRAVLRARIDVVRARAAHVLSRFRVQEALTNRTTP